MVKQSQTGSKTLQDLQKRNKIVKYEALMILKQQTQNIQNGEPCDSVTLFGCHLTSLCTTFLFYFCNIFHMFRLQLFSILHTFTLLSEI